MDITDAKITVDGKVYEGNDYRIENVVLGQDIAEQWPSGTQISSTSASQWRPPMKFYGWNDPNDGSVWATKRFKVTSDMLYGEKQAGDGTYFVKLTSSWRNDLVEKTVNYHLENINGDYDRSDKYSQTFYAPQSPDLLPKEIDGFDYNPSHKVENNGPLVYDFYYDRHRYSIDYYYADQKLNTIPDIPFESDINNDTYTKEPTTRPIGVDDDYTWVGWYEDPELTTP